MVFLTVFTLALDYSLQKISLTFMSARKLKKDSKICSWRFQIFFFCKTNQQNPPGVEKKEKKKVAVVHLPRCRAESQPDHSRSNDPSLIALFSGWRGRGHIGDMTNPLGIAPARVRGLGIVHHMVTVSCCTEARPRASRRGRHKPTAENDITINSFWKQYTV